MGRRPADLLVLRGSQQTRFLVFFFSFLVHFSPLFSLFFSQPLARSKRGAQCFNRSPSDQMVGRLLLSFGKRRGWWYMYRCFSRVQDTFSFSFIPFPFSPRFGEAQLLFLSFLSVYSFTHSLTHFRTSPVSRSSGKDGTDSPLLSPFQSNLFSFGESMENPFSDVFRF